MSPKGRKKSKKGESLGPTQHAVDSANRPNRDFVDSTVMSEIESAKKQIEILQEKNVELIAENKQLKEEVRKLKEIIDRDCNVSSGTQENYSMDIEFISSSEDVLGTSKNTDNSSGRQCAAGCVDTTDVNWNSQGDAKEDVCHTSKVIHWNNESELEQDNACGYTEGVLVGHVETSDDNWNSQENTKQDMRHASKSHVWGSESEHDQENVSRENEDVHGNAMQQNHGSQYKRHDGRSSWYDESAEFKKNSDTTHDLHYGGKKSGRGYNSRCYHNDRRQNYEQHDGNKSRRGHDGKQYEQYDDNKSGRGDDGRQYSWSDYRPKPNFNQRGGNDRQYYGNDSRERNQSQYDKSKGQSCKLKIIEKDGDLFTAPKDHSLAHCVAADLRMGSGIAVQFKQQFKNVDSLLEQRKKVGQVAVLEEDGRYIYYLITKKFSTGKPRLTDLQDTLTDMREHVERYQVKNIAVPRLGCGLDRLHWRDVRILLYEIFKDVDVTITVYNFTVDSTSGSSKPPPKKPSIYVSDKLMKLVNIESQTLLVLFGSECGYVDDVMKELDEKFRFIHEYKAHSRKLGDNVEIIKGKELICILIVKKHINDHISYSSVFNCFLNLRKPFKYYGYEFMGLTAFTDGDDDLTVAKIVTCLKIAFANVRSNAWICWPTELKNVYDEYNSSHKADV